jgi:predicted signal transduction protein with EAL and GGDEF domain
LVQPGDTLDSVLQRADLALYRAKERGGNRVAPAWVTSGANPGQDIPSAG